MKDNGTAIKWMDKAYFVSLMVIYTLGNLNKINLMGRESTSIIIQRTMMASGKMI